MRVIARDCLCECACESAWRARLNLYLNSRRDCENTMCILAVLSFWGGNGDGGAGEGEIGVG